jgi:hypothetical protein
MKDLGADFEHRTGYKIIQQSKTRDPPATVKKRINAYERFGAAFLSAPVLD